MQSKLQRRVNGRSWYACSHGTSWWWFVQIFSTSLALQSGTSKRSCLAYRIISAVARSAAGTSNFNCPNAPTSLAFLAWKNHLRLSKFWVTWRHEAITNLELWWIMVIWPHVSQVHLATKWLWTSDKVTKWQSLAQKLGTSETGSEHVAGNLPTSVCTVQETLLTVREVAGTRPWPLETKRKLSLISVTIPLPELLWTQQLTTAKLSLLNCVGGFPLSLPTSRR